jgi:competence ComEA-like helix-hairpin-helix protein
MVVAMNPLAALQRLLGINRREAIAVCALVGLLAGGALYRWLSEPNEVVLPMELERLLDSLALASMAPPAAEAFADTTHRTRPKQAPSQLPREAVNLNTATKAELMSLPGVGEVIAERILEYRRQKRFETPEELMEVKGIGPKKFQRIRPYIRVD